MIPTSLPSVRLSLASRAGHKFTPPTMIQGFACHARGVEIQTASATRVVARVRSKRTYEVDLRAIDGRLLVGCACPARSYGLDVCKHVWAALLEVDRRGGLESLREATGALIVEAATFDDARAKAAKKSASKKVKVKVKVKVTPKARAPKKTKKP